MIEEIHSETDESAENVDVSVALLLFDLVFLSGWILLGSAIVCVI
jgi:hypothetical protein